MCYGNPCIKTPGYVEFKENETYTVEYGHTLYTGLVAHKTTLNDDGSVCIGIGNFKLLNDYSY